ncbi:MAG TPA: DUF4956 domain-containing protein [Gemmatimonadaceae bacterium]|nr:DUF4956 domain-containing protein [Gemmatimonadaceae bacterium]
MMRARAPEGNNGRSTRLSPVGRHLAWLSVYYLVLTIVIGVVGHVTPPLESGRQHRLRESARLDTLLTNGRGTGQDRGDSPRPPSLRSLARTADSAFTWPAIADRARAIVRPIVAMLGAVALALAVAWVYVITRRKKGFSQSIVHTLIILPVAVAGIMVLVQNNLALAFSLAGIAALRFRNTLDDTKDAVYLFVGTGIGIAAAVDELDVGLALSLIFNLAVLVLWWSDVGRTPSRLKAKLTLRRLRQTMETRIPVGIPTGALDPLNAVLRVHAVSVEPAQVITEQLLADVAKQWELTGVTRGDHGQSQLDYIVRLRSRTRRGELLRDLRDRGGPHVTGAEFK